MTTAWTCAECTKTNTLTAKFCAHCGQARNEATSSPAPAFIPPWERPGFKPSKPTDRCDVDGCTLTVRQHMDEFDRITSKPGTVLSRPSQRAQQVYALPDEAALEARRQLLAAQARQLRAPATEPVAGEAP